MSDEKRPWINYPHIWKSESAFMSFIRGGIRKSLWNMYPIKLETIKKKRKRIKNPNPKGKNSTVFGGECYLCGEDFPQKDLQVDHVSGNHSLKSADDIQSFVENLLFVSEDDLELVCKKCHNIKSYADRYNISFEEARIKKNIIELMKDKKKVDDLLKSKGFAHSNDSIRKRNLEILLKREELLNAT